jgi:hypothetical protein
MSPCFVVVITSPFPTVIHSCTCLILVIPSTFGVMCTVAAVSPIQRSSSLGKVFRLSSYIFNRRSMYGPALLACAIFACSLCFRDVQFSGLLRFLVLNLIEASMTQQDTKISVIHSLYFQLYQQNSAKVSSLSIILASTQKVSKQRSKFGFDHSDTVVGSTSTISAGSYQKTQTEDRRTGRPESTASRRILHRPEVLARQGSSLIFHHRCSQKSFIYLRIGTMSKFSNKSTQR